MRKTVSLWLLVVLALGFAGCGPAKQGSGTIEIKGKVSSAPSKNRRGQDITVAAIAVVEAKTADGKAVDDLKGKTVLTNRRDGETLLKYDGKEITVTGVLDPASNNVFRVESVKDAGGEAPAAPPK